jgi:hypothetical protein
MKTATYPDLDSSIPPDIMADLEAVCRAAATGQPLDPEIRNRVRERADKVREEIFQTHGLLDIGVPAIRELRDGE